MPGDRTVVLPVGLQAAVVARQFLTCHSGHLPAELLDDAQVCVSELVSNAILHGQPEVTLQLQADPSGIRVAVTDHGPELPVTAEGRPDSTSTHGRGLQIVAALADQWGVTHNRPAGDAPSKTIWFELRP